MVKSNSAGYRGSLASYAAEQGHTGAQFNLSTMYANGWGVPQDYVSAHMSANLAGARGDDEARDL